MRILYTIPGGLPILNSELTWQRFPFVTVTCRQHQMAKFKHKKDKNRTTAGYHSNVSLKAFYTHFEAYPHRIASHCIAAHGANPQVDKESFGWRPRREDRFFEHIFSLIHKQCHPKSCHSHIKRHMTLNAIFSVALGIVVLHMLNASYSSQITGKILILVMNSSDVRYTLQHNEKLHGLHQ